MRNANAPSKPRGFTSRPDKPGSIHDPHRAAFRAEIARALEDLGAIMAGLDITHCLPTDVPAAFTPRRQNYVRR